MQGHHASAPSCFVSCHPNVARTRIESDPRLHVPTLSELRRLFIDHDGDYLRGVTRSPAVHARNVLRSSWHFRQRQAGRLKEQDHRHGLNSTTCSMLCASHLLFWLPVVPPSATVVTLWDGVLRAALLYIAVFSPLQAAFPLAFHSPPWHATNLACELLFLLNPLLCFRRGFMHDGMFISDPIFVAAHYLQGDFVTDVIAAFPYAWLLGVRLQPENDQNPRTAPERLLPFLRVLRIIIPLIRYLSTADHNEGSTAHGRLNPGVTRVLRAFLTFLFTCHCFACLWWCIGELEQDGLLSSTSNSTSRTDPTSEDRWGPSPWLRGTQPVANQYAHAFLWGASMMTGYITANVEPQALPEVVVTVLVLFFGVIFNTAIISTTTSALQSISFKSSKVVHKMQNIHQYMRHKRVPLALASQISSFYEYQLSPYRSGEGQQELSDLPPRLAMELILHTHRQLFCDCPIFRLVPPPTALSLVEHFTPVVFVPGEIVISEGKTNSSLYVINRGLVKVWRRDLGSPGGQLLLTTLTDSDFFGEQTLLKTITSKTGDAEVECKANATCQCSSYCDMFRLTSDDFMGVLEEARNRHSSWEGKDVAGILNDAADERNMRSECTRRRKHSLMWAAAGQKMIDQNRKAKARLKMTKMSTVSRLACGAQSSFRSSSSRSRPPPALPPASEIPPSNTASASRSFSPKAVSRREYSRRMVQQQQQQQRATVDENGPHQESAKVTPVLSSPLQFVVDGALALLNKAGARKSSGGRRPPSPDLDEEPNLNA